MIRKSLDDQIDGIYDGYMEANKDKPERVVFIIFSYSQKVSKWQIQYANYDSDVGDWNSLPHDNANTEEEDETRRDHCSALLRMTENKDDIFIGQNTWTSLELMFRVYKVYDISLHLENGDIIPGHLQGFSSYPARISSGDDYYTVGDHMVVQETTIGFTNKELQKYMTGEGVMQWARNVIANRLAEQI